MRYVKEEIPYYEYQRRIKEEKIPYYESWIGEEELAQVTEVIRANWVSEGVKTREFEQRLAEIFGVKYSLAVSNCTAALIISLTAMGIGRGDEVIAPDFTFIASINAIRLAGATPGLVDINPQTFTIDPDAAEAAITPKTKAIMPVHLYGQAAEIDRICAIAEKHGLRVIEDTAQGLGVKFRDQPVGSFGDVSCLSFFADKSITIGEGGLVLTNSEDLFKELLMLKNDGRLERGIYLHDRVGYNFRITDLQAAVGVAQLNKLDTIIHRKRGNEELYRQLLADVNGVELPYRDPRCFGVPHRVNILVDDPESLQRYLAQKGIGSRRFYYPVHRQPCYNISAHFPNTEHVYSRGLSLPSAPTLAESQIEFVSAKIKDYFQGAK